MKKIVIIGATGYVGSAILKEALGRGHQVKAIVRDPSKLTLIHPHLKVVGGNVTDTDFLSRELAKSDAVISAFNPGWSNPNIYEETLEGYGSILCAVRNSGVHRFLMVGGAGSLLVAPGRQLMDEPDVPKKLLPGIRGMAKVYTDLLLPEKSVDWVFLSPAANMAPGERTGKFRLGKDELIVDESGRADALK
ncbi:3-beta hydroxysteroid dehydrogenase [Parabacteroides goldsteinii]|uniref:NAD(P)-dependent oxidoreductase n=1 Tax=Parabacteroides TaxID=375288 RepID=UPI001F238584|nr:MULTISPECIES: NAD(P)H-binding protein [Parabacteroides]GKG71321.1 3-beta hydroxysteroid dehydrogenase [Parabacteroides goldsteinii]GKG77274.1 3-beta hydroxysteroid dehydrogenase [Parabacteroides goldsteinii]